MSNLTSLFFILIFSICIINCKELNTTQISCKMKNCKVELHIHLESGITNEMALKLIKKYEPDNSIHTVEDLRKKLNFTNFHELTEKYAWMNSYLREKEDFSEITLELLNNLARRGVIYVELNYLYKISENSTISTYEQTEAIISAMRKGKELYNINSNLLIGFPRRIHDENFYIGVLEEVKEFISLPSPRLIGMSIIGLDSKKSSHQYINLVNYARSLGLKITVNTGEYSDTKEIWATIKYLNPDRLAHAVNAYRDLELLKYLNETRLPIELCVTSNLKTNAISVPINYHPIKYFKDLGLKVFFNSDHPLFLDSYIDQEMKLLINTFGFSNLDIEKMFENALDSSFISKEEKKLIREYCDLNCGEFKFLDECTETTFPFIRLAKKILFFN